MNRICKQYISEVKTFFPIIGKDERTYIAKLITNVDNFCDEDDITTKEELYKRYGLPNDVVNDYYSTIDSEKIIKRIRISKYVKCSMIILLLLAFVATSYYCFTLHHAYKQFTSQEVIIFDEVIEWKEHK